MRPALAWEVRIIRQDKPPLPLARFLYRADCVDYFSQQCQLEPDFKLEIVEVVWEEPYVADYIDDNVKF